MSDPKRATLITVGAPKSAKVNVNKTVRLTINLDESNESKYPELNYKELVIAEERKKHIQNGKTAGLDPFSDNDDADVERVARKFEQKYGGKSTYGKRKRRSKQDDFADIGAGYDENDSFIDNTHGYDEMIPPECDTFHGGFYINCGSLEFKNVPQDQSTNADEPANRRNKRRISSSSSEEESSESSSECESQDGDERGPNTIANGDLDLHKTEHRKKKNKKTDKKKAKKVRRTDSSAATSGKQTSDENAHGDAESVDCGDSRTSHSDSLTSKPAPSSENVVTSDSSRDAEARLPASVTAALEAIEAARPSPPSEALLLRLEQALQPGAAGGGGGAGGGGAVGGAGGGGAVGGAGGAGGGGAAGGGARGARAGRPETSTTTSVTQPTTVNTTATTTTATTTTTNKRKTDDDGDIDYSHLTDEQREAKIVETLERLKTLIEERKPSMLANYTAECERVQEERKKLQIALAAEGAPHIEKRLPKRRFPWCGRSRALLARLTRLAVDSHQAALLLSKRALPLFPNGFVRMPTLLRQADLSKEIKVSDIKRQRLGSASHLASTVIQANTQTPTISAAPFTEPLQFPSTLTVTTMVKTSPEKTETVETDEKYKSSIFGCIANSFSLSKDLIVEKEKKDDKKEELYIPPNNIGSITITAVPNQKEKKTSVIVSDKQPTTGGLIRVKSPAALNDMVTKKDIKVVKKQEKTHSNPKEKRVESPLHIDTSYQPSKKDPSPKIVETNKKPLSPKTKDEITKKQIENMRVAENNIPRPVLVPVQHSPTFIKPDKRPPEGKKKKDIIVVSDVDPLGDLSEPVNVDDSSSDVEVIETDKSDSLVPSKDKRSSVKSVPKVKDGRVDDDLSDADMKLLLKNIQEMQHSQEPSSCSSNSYGGVITSAKHEPSNKGNYKRSTIFGDARNDKFAERTSLNKMDGSNPITG